MSNVDAPMKYAEPVADRTDRDGSIGLIVLLGLGVAFGAVSIAMLSRDTAEPFVLAVLAGLAIVGVFSLFAGAAGLLRFAERAPKNDFTQAYADNLPNGALILQDGEIQYANEAYLRLVGAIGEDTIPPIERAFSGTPEIADAVYRLLRAGREGRSWSEEFAVPLGGEDDGQSAASRWYRISVRPCPAGSVGTGRRPLTVWEVADLTGDRRQEEDAFDKLQQVIAYLDSAPVGFLSSSPGGRVEYLNATLAHWLGIELSEAAAGEIALQDLMSADAAAMVRQVADGPSPGEVTRFDLDLISRDGMSVPVRVFHRVMELPDGENQLSHMLVMNRGPGSETEEGGQSAEIRFTRFFHSAPIAIVTIDRAGRIQKSNAAFARMFGAAGERQAENRAQIIDLVDADSRSALEKAIEAALSGQVVIEPVEATYGEDSSRNGRLFLSPVEENDGSDEAAIVYAVDATEQRALEVQIAQSQKMQAIGQLAGGIAHDFNNVLTAIIGFSELLLANHRPTDPAFQDIMNIKQNANRAAGLVRQLLAFSRQQTLRPQVLGLNDVLTDLSILLGRLIGEKISLDVATGSDLWKVKADLHQFEQVIINLAVNARDAMPDGGRLTIRTANMSERDIARLGEPLMQEGEYVLCEVVDTGTGMPTDVREKIFEPFFSTKEVGKGTGLGLSTVYGIVKQTGGFIFVDSELGHGTTFRIYLPRHFVDETENVVEAPKPDAPKRSKDLTGTGTVLLVEDEEAVRSFAARALAGRGYEVLEASTGAEALEVMDDHTGTVDLVVSDVVMPEMDGPTLLKELRKTNPELKIIFISGYAEDAFKKNLDANEHFVFLPKPFSLKQLAEAVKDTLEG